MVPEMVPDMVPEMVPEMQLQPSSRCGTATSRWASLFSVELHIGRNQLVSCWFPHIYSVPKGELVVIGQATVSLDWKDAPGKSLLIVYNVEEAFLLL